MAAEARHLGRLVCVWAPRAGPKAAGRLGKHPSTQPVAEDVGVETRRHASAALRNRALGQQRQLLPTSLVACSQ